MKLLIVEDATRLRNMLGKALARQGHTPVERLATRTAEIGAASLARRLQVAELPVELQPITEELNGLVARLQQSFERERRFSSDVAHELRTPLAELLTLAEMGQQWADQATPEAFGEVLTITREMEAMVVKLRQLASTENGTQPVDRRPMDLAASIDAAWEPLREQASGRGIRLETAVAPATLVTDPLLWRSILTNLLDNAVTYSPDGSAIRLAAGADHVAIRNPAGELGPEDLECLFDRFWRKDTARAGYGHSGLGLSLVRGFCELLGWRIRASLAPPPELEIDTSSGPELEIRIDFDRRISDA